MEATALDEGQAGRPISLEAELRVSTPACEHDGILEFQRPQNDRAD